jgi:hypothetical protein
MFIALSVATVMFFELHSRLASPGNTLLPRSSTICNLNGRPHSSSQRWGFRPVVCLVLTFRGDKAQALDIDLKLFCKHFTAIKANTKANVIKQVILYRPQEVSSTLIWCDMCHSQTAVNTFNGIDRLVFVLDTQCTFCMVGPDSLNVVTRLHWPLRGNDRINNYRGKGYPRRNRRML